MRTTTNRSRARIAVVAAAFATAIMVATRLVHEEASYVLDDEPAAAAASASDLAPWSPVIVDTPENWSLRRSIAEAQAARQIQSKHIRGRAFFQNNWEPSVGCAYERRLGRSGDGGKWICDPDSLKTHDSVLVYSMGSNNEFSFEEEIRALLGDKAEIHTFDVGKGLNVPPYVTYHEAMVTSLCDVMRDLGHLRRTVDILKMDIEGSEFDVLLSASKNGCLRLVNQISLEAHLMGWFAESSKKAHEMFRALTARDHFEIFHKEANIQYSGGDACEFSLVKVHF